MIELLTAAQMRAIEQAAISDGEVTGLELMERAGRGVVQAIFEEWPELKATSHRAVVLCGPGNNGGDGFVVARLLRQWGWNVRAFLYGDAGRLPPDARANHERWTALGSVEPLSALDRSAFTDAAVVIDALFGTGLSRPVEQAVWGVLAMAQQAGARLVAVDILSGICADSGRIISLGGFVETPAALTVTFERAKLGHALADGAMLSGRLRLVPIGLDQQMNALLGGSQSDDIVTVSQAPVLRLRKAQGHKYTHGHALVLSGRAGRGGAARLAARGALRIGAGLVTVGCPPEASAENAARLDAVMLREVADGPALAQTLEDGRINALCLGPGMGTGAREAGLVAAALQCRASDRYSHRSLVLDADALTILSRNPDLLAALHSGCVLTPHFGEFARLFPDIAERLAAPATEGPAYSKVEATRAAARRAGCVVLFKGPDTVIADASGRCAVNPASCDRAAPWLATGGSGDVLAGFITGLLARGWLPFDAACTGARLHLECALSFGPGLIAEDLPETLPSVLRALGV
ncbi:MAG: NAD(P)H-hydrate dehydratase [Tabrizicola sp.]